MSSYDAETVVVGAGASGLAAFAELKRAGREVICLEARGRIGGRMYTLHDPFSPVPIELGAEFIHGRPPEIWDIVRSQGLSAYDVTGSGLHLSQGKVSARSNTWELVGQVLEEMRAAAAAGPDRTFAEFLRGSRQSPEAQQWATSYIEGFNAADQHVIGIASLAKDADAADHIDGDAAFRILSGYDSIARSLLHPAAGLAEGIRFHSVVEAIEWRSGSVRITARSSLTGETEILRAAKLILTVPLGVLTAAAGQPGAIGWDPVPEGALEAARKLAFGQVYRVVLRFHEPFWEANPELADAGFLLSDEAAFPTWWTTLAVRAPVLTGWSAGPHADTLLGKSKEAVISEALQSLERITDTGSQKLRALLCSAYFHDWYSDPFARGAYSYVPAGSLAARETLARPIAGTIYFSGEATELDGHSATVHGAIRSGRRAVRDLMEQQ